MGRCLYCKAGGTKMKLLIIIIVLIIWIIAGVGLTIILIEIFSDKNKHLKTKIMKTEKCRRDPEFIYCGKFRNGNSFELHIPERDIPEFVATLIKANNDDKNRNVQFFIPRVVIDENGDAHFADDEDKINFADDK